MTATAIRPFVSPARMLCRGGASAAAGAELLAAGARPGDGTVLLVADRVLLELGLVRPAIAALEAADFTVDVRPGVGAEPAPETVRELLPGERGPVAGVVAIGGGSALDAAKLVALASAQELDLTAGLLADAAVDSAPPLLAVPTTAGTGAEATAVAMLWHGGRKVMFVHGALVPTGVLLDPQLLLDLPAPITASSGLDAISHAAESLLSTFRSPPSEAAAKSALGLLAKGLPAAYAEGDEASRETTLLGAYQAGLALNASVVLGHSLAYVIAAEAELPHGVSCAMALPYCLAHARPAREEAIAEIAEIVCDDDEAGAEDLVRWLLDANAEMGIPPSLEAVGIDAARLPELTRSTVEDYRRPNHPVPIDAEGVGRLLRDFMVGDALASWSRSGSLA
jgi:alcohol dehydrogenase class IV